MDLIHQLVCDKEDRLGQNGADEIKRHPFFRNIDWNNLRNTESPWIPQLDNELDTCNFDTFEEVDDFYPPVPKKKLKKKDGNFVGFTYKRSESQRNSLVSALQSLDTIGSSRLSAHSSVLENGSGN